MSKDLTIQIDDELHREIVKRSGGPRKISRFLVPIIEAALKSAESDQGADIAELRAEILKIKERIDRLEAGYK
jgi:ribosomal protein L22